MQLNGSEYITKKNNEYITKKKENNYISKKEEESESEEDDKVQLRVDDLYTFALNATIGTLMHEIGHALIDMYDIPVFANEEDVADSFLTYYLI